MCVKKETGPLGHCPDDPALRRSTLLFTFVWPCFITLLYQSHRKCQHKKNIFLVEKTLDITHTICYNTIMQNNEYLVPLKIDMHRAVIVDLFNTSKDRLIISFRYCEDHDFKRTIWVICEIEKPSLGISFGDTIWLHESDPVAAFLERGPLMLFKLKAVDIDPDVLERLTNEFFDI